MIGHRRLGPAASAVLLATGLVGCTADRERSPATVSVEREVEIAADGSTTTCFATCANSTPASDRLANRCEADDEGFEPPTCGFVAGRDNIRVSVDYGVEARSAPPPTDPTVTLVLDGVAMARQLDFDFPVQHAKHGLFTPIAVALLRAPITDAKAISFRVTIPNDVVVENSGAFNVVAASPTLTIRECDTASDCSIASGRAVTLELRAPAGFASSTATLETELDGIVQVVSTPVTFTMHADHDEAHGMVRTVIGTDASKDFRVTATLGTYKASASGKLTLPRAPALLIGAAGAPAAAGDILPPRAIGEPSTDCRTYDIAVSVPDSPQTGSVSLETSAGVLGDADEKLVLPLETSGAAHTRLVLPAPAPPLVKLTLAVDATRTIQRWIALENVLPRRDRGRLTARATKVLIDRNGIPNEVQLRGTLETVLSAKFSPTTHVLVKTRVIRTADGPLPCGISSNTSVLSCDPSATSASDRGGCFLTDAITDVAEDGSYNIRLNPGFCFAGDIEISTLSRVYVADPSPGQCLGETPRSLDMETVGLAVISFEVPPGADAG